MEFVVVISLSLYVACSKKVYGNAMQKGGIGPVFDMKPDEVVAFKSGGKSVEELTGRLLSF